MNPTALIDQLMSGLSGQSHGQGQGQGQGLSGGKGSSFPGGVGGAAAAAGIAGLLLGSKKGRKMAGKAAKYGGVAVLGGLAYRAWQQHQSGKSGPLPPSPASDDFTPPSDERFLPDAREDALPMALLKAMIAAAKADGHIDSAEQSRIFDAINTADLASDDKALLFDELNKPLDPDAIGSLATSPEMATEIYAASVVVVGEANRDERRYLDRLAGRLNLDPGLQDAIESEAGLLPSA